jgi:hypothetical protein
MRSLRICWWQGLTRRSKGLPSYNRVCEPALLGSTPTPALAPKSSAAISECRAIRSRFRDFVRNAKEHKNLWPRARDRGLLTSQPALLSVSCGGKRLKYLTARPTPLRTLKNEKTKKILRWTVPRAGLYSRLLLERPASTPSASARRVSNSSFTGADSFPCCCCTHWTAHR